MRHIVSTRSFGALGISALLVLGFACKITNSCAQFWNAFGIPLTSCFSCQNSCVNRHVFAVFIKKHKLFSARTFGSRNCSWFMHSVSFSTACRATYCPSRLRHKKVYSCITWSERPESPTRVLRARKPFGSPCVRRHCHNLVLFRACSPDGTPPHVCSQ